MADNKLQISETMMDQKSEERQNLLSRLLDAVKQCQIRFGGKKELATDMDSRVGCLCQQLEAVLQHGMRQPEANTFRQVCDAIVQNLSINLPGSDAEPPVFWHFVRRHMTRHEYERYLLLVNVNSDSGRGRAWLRSTLNENSLERYLHALIGDREGVARFYEPWALLADQERNAVLPNVAAGLSSILFAISIDRCELNGVAARPRPKPAGEAAAAGARPEPEAVVRAQSVEVRSRPAARRRRRHVQAQRVSFDSESGSGTATPLWRSAPATCVSSPAAVGQAFSFDGGGAEQEGDGSSRSEHSLPGGSSGEDVSVRSEELSAEVTQQLRLCAPDDGAGSALTPLEYRLSASPREADHPSAALCNGFVSPSEVGRDPEPALPGCPSQQLAPPPSRPGAPLCTDLASTASLSEGQLRQALAAVGAQRATLQEQASELRLQLEQVDADRQRLRDESECAKTQWEEKLAVLESKKLTSERENAILKHQLKKYVSAVQLLRHGSPHETLEALQEAGDRQRQQHRQRHADYHAEAEAYQQKLIQVAEMHGELMEFNDRLRSQLTRRERQLASLRAELAECGVSDTAGSEPEQEQEEPPPAGPPQPQPRVHCWIPSAFLSGSGSAAHHVYQVYVRIRDEEWNVYHRYSRFNQLYNTMKKDYPEVKQFNFPRKKTLNNKDGRLVEERRRQLQEFLRCVTRALLAAQPHLARAPSRAALVAAEPFFGAEPAAGDSGGASETGPRLLSLFGRSPTAPAPTGPRYTGL